ncbi:MULTISPECIES: Dps family protein [Arthrobacter]|uniref:DNA starvation/stationary phase protection protein n=1 Tax=Arthrobacter terricola TaxID=2547396 RepID=A0A4R5KTN9_9MICC|nr:MULTISPECIES: DNA starvation/stationary phase protection protein [Arthrobacter]MBT8160515.1 DNA starvation/stationary phase protection protein [Arthrobacter sp. GN70]TDF98448.1 DNA starvation/stationary phase protection protein [Arthrobacter terricola]
MKASQTLADNLQLVLTDLIELQLQGKQAHWNIVGANFRDLHLQLDELVEATRLFGDSTAERMRSLHALPDGRSATIAGSTRLEQFPAGLTTTKDAVKLITARVERTVQTMRDVHDQVDEEDPTSADLLHEMIARLEQLAWMISAETMTANTSVTDPGEA